MSEGWLPVARKEYIENVRNWWIIAVGGIFLVLTLAASGFAGVLDTFGSRARLASIVPTLEAMGNVTDFLLPILALMLGFATIAGERESGSLGLLVAQPLTRLDIVVGKWVGLWGVLATALVAGVGVGGLVVLVSTSGGLEGLQALLTFLLATLAWGAAWTSITLLVSAFFQRRGTAIGGAVLVWFVFTRFVWTLLTLLVVVAALDDGLREAIMDAGNGRVDAPGWLILTQVLNPNTAYDGLVATTIAGYDTFAAEIAREMLPDLYRPLTFVVALAAWIALPFLGAYRLFARRDV